MTGVVYKAGDDDPSEACYIAIIFYFFQRPFILLEFVLLSLFSCFTSVFCLLGL